MIYLFCYLRQQHTGISTVETDNMIIVRNMYSIGSVTNAQNSAKTASISLVH